MLKKIIYVFTIKLNRYENRLKVNLASDWNMSKDLTINEALELGIKAHRSGQIEAADQYYTAVLKTQPKHPDANHNMGVLAVNIGKLEESIPYFKTALEVNSSIEQFWLSYIDVLLKLNRTQEVKALISKAREKDVIKDIFSRLDLIEARIDNSKLPIQLSKTQEPPQDEIDRLMVLFNDGKMQTSLHIAEKLHNKYPTSIILMNIIAASNKDLGNSNQALEAFKKVLLVKPNDAATYNNIGIVLQEQGKIHKAIGFYKKALSLKADFAEAHYNLGNALKQMSEHDSAVCYYKNAILSKPNFVEAYHNMGNVFQEQGKFDEAINAFNKALYINPNFVEALNNIGNILQQQGKPKKR